MKKEKLVFVSLLLFAGANAFAGEFVLPKYFPVSWPSLKCPKVARPGSVYQVKYSGLMKESLALILDKVENNEVFFKQICSYGQKTIQIPGRGGSSAQMESGEFVYTTEGNLLDKMNEDLEVVRNTDGTLKLIFDTEEFKGSYQIAATKLTSKTYHFVVSQNDKTISSFESEQIVGLFD